MPNKKELRILTTELPEIREEGEEKKIVGYAVKWGKKSEPIWGCFEEKFERGAFKESLKKQDVYAAYQHDVRETIGRTPKTLKLEEDSVGLRYEITPPKWFDKIESIERGDVKGSSFIFEIDEGKEEWDRSGKMPIRTIKQAKLYEVSPVTNPAYKQSTAGVRSAEDVYKEYEEEIRKQDEQEADHEHEKRKRDIEIEELEIN